MGIFLVLIPNNIASKKPTSINKNKPMLIHEFTLGNCQKIKKTTNVAITKIMVRIIDFASF